MEVKVSAGKSINPKASLTFDDVTQQTEFLAYLENMAFDLDRNHFINTEVTTKYENILPFDMPGMRGIKVKITGSAVPVPADPISAIATAVSDVAKLSGQIISWVQQGRAKKDELADMDVETTSLEPLVATLFATYPFIAAQYAGERQNIINQIEAAKGKKKNPFFKQLNSLLKSVVESVKPYSKILKGMAPWISDTPVTPIDFSVQFADYFAKNPTPEMIAEAKKLQNTPGTPGTPKTETQGFSPLVVGGGLMLAYLFLTPKKSKKSKR